MNYPKASPEKLALLRELDERENRKKEIRKKRKIAERKFARMLVDIQYGN